MIVILYVDWWMNSSPGQCVRRMLRVRFYTPSGSTLEIAIQSDSISAMRNFPVALKMWLLDCYILKDFSSLCAQAQLGGSTDCSKLCIHLGYMKVGQSEMIKYEPLNK